MKITGGAQSIKVIGFGLKHFSVEHQRFWISMLRLKLPSRFQQFQRARIGCGGLTKGRGIPLRTEDEG